MLNHRPIRSGLGLVRPAWPCRPLVPGAWREVPTALIDGLIAVCDRHSRGIDDTLPAPIDRLRSMELGFLTDCFLLEGVSRLSPTADGVFRAILGKGFCYPLDGRAAQLRRVPVRPKISGTEEGGNNAADYLRLFCAVVHGEEGPFRIIERWRDLPLASDPDAHQEAVLRENVGPLRRVSGEKNQWLAAVQYGTSIYSCEFAVHRDGTVLMTRDTPVAENVLHAVRQDGMWEVFPDAAPGPASKPREHTP